MPEYKNCFARAEHYEHEILDQKGATIGRLRLKPSGVLWKPANQHKYYAVNLDTFAAWITNPKTGARRTKS